MLDRPGVCVCVVYVCMCVCMCVHVCGVCESYVRFVCVSGMYCVSMHACI